MQDVDYDRSNSVKIQTSKNLELIGPFFSAAEVVFAKLLVGKERSLVPKPRWISKRRRKGKGQKPPQ